jgi:hypothetical protein
MRIGIDFDNTIADYDDVFRLAAIRERLVGEDFSGGKLAVREAVRALERGEERWMRLQGRIYGAFMGEARPVRGFEGFLAAARRAGAELYIISHKTEYGHFDEERVNLRDAARRWMRERGFLGAGAVPEANLFFEASRGEKVERIRQVGCVHFIDDLEEVFREPGFPASVARHLLCREGAALPTGPFTAYRGWSEIGDALFR